MDISSQIIAQLRAEIVELKKRVSALEEKFNNKEEDKIQDVSQLSLICVFEPNTSSHHEEAHQDVVQCAVHELEGSASVSPVCDSVCSDTKQHSTSALYPTISSVCTVFKREPDPMEIHSTAGLNGVADHIALQEMNDVSTVTPVRKRESSCEVPLSWDCHEGLQTPLKMCSVQLVDCGKKLKQVTKRVKASRTYKCRRSSRVKIPHSKRLKHPLDCSLCCKTMSTASSLKTVKSDQMRKKIYQCSQCERKFKYFHAYIRHKKIHKRKQLHHNLDKTGDTDLQSGELGYPCTVCGKVHTYLRLPKDHMKAHTGEKPYECSYCGLRFAYPQNHMNHLRKHTGEKPYKCKYCASQFALELCLKEHVKMHTE